MINIDKVIGKTVVYLGGLSAYFTKGEAYRIGRDDYCTLFTIDNEGERHTMDEEWLLEVFDVSEYIEKPSLVGKYVRYVADGSEFMNKGDIGFVRSANSYGRGFEVSWLNPKEPHTDYNPTWFVLPENVEVVE